MKGPGWYRAVEVSFAVGLIHASRSAACKQVVSFVMFRLLIIWVAGYLPVCRDEPTFEAISVLELAGLRL